MIIHDKVEQGSEEWRQLRSGKLTASNAQAIASNGKGLETYCLQVVADKYALAEEQYTNKDIERGNELEDQARSMYEMENGVKIKQVGFVEINEYVGCSPDGLIDPDKGIEIKCHNNAKHFSLLLNGEKAIDSRYMWQMQMSMFLTGREWIFIAYNPNFEQSLVTFDIKPDEKKMEKLQKGIEAGKEKIKTLDKQYKELWQN